jgi:predicted nucleotidyltransferase
VPAKAAWGDAIRHLLDASRHALGGALIGVYLHGSAALDDWVPGASDLDVLVVVEDGAAQTAVDVVAAAADEAITLAPTSGIELSVITRDLAERPRAPWPYRLHVATSPAAAPRIVHDAGGGDPDLLMHIVVTRAAGIAVAGPAPRDLFGEIPRAEVLRYLVSELDWGLNHGSEKYAVLNACRALAYLRSGAILAKTAGGEWAATHLPGHATVISRALDEQRRGLVSTGISAEARELVTDVAQELARAAS